MVDAPQPLRFLERTKILLLPPNLLVAEVMKGAVVDGTERYRPLIAHLAAEGPWLGEAEVMGLAGVATANQAVPRGDELEVFRISDPSRAFLR